MKVAVGFQQRLLSDVFQAGEKMEGTGEIERGHG